MDNQDYMTGILVPVREKTAQDVCKNKYVCGISSLLSAVDVERLVSEACNISVADILLKTRGVEQAANARQIAMYLMHVGLSMSHSKVARHFKRDRTTVSHACARVEDRRSDVKFDEMISSIENKLF
ncbi:MAG: hypothetical protein L3J15_05850 [Devosiaceae bacterium]|nr:hypothetical protein [Devosiaceae bacterium]